MAIVIALLAILGVMVGAASEFFLRNTLYHQLEAKLVETSQFAAHGPGFGSHAGRNSDQAPAGAELDWVALRVDPTGVSGGLVRYRQGPALSGTGTVYYAVLVPSDLPIDALNQLRALPTDSAIHNVHLSGLGDYKVISIHTDDGVAITGVPLSSTRTILLAVAGVTSSAVLLALIIAGWVGAFVIRRNLVPLERVAATATRVSELRLDRGAVEMAQRVPAADADARTEVGQVGAALNRLLDHVGSALEARHNSEMQVRQFVADASHELRTPLAAIRGYAELSRRSRQPVPAEIGHVLRRVESEAQRMTGLVDDLLLLARLDAGRPLAHDPVDLTALVVDAVSDAHAAGPRHDWRLNLPEEPVTVIGDQLRLHQVLANLLANARTHTPEGTTVTVAVKASPDTAMIQVLDTGPGIPAELQPHIFERFARGDSSRSRAAGSTGLGLSIVYAVVVAHGGQVTVQSVPGQTAFNVFLPLSPAGGNHRRFPPAPGSAALPDAVHQYVPQIVQ